MNPWQALAEAVVIQAANDYRSALTQKRLYPETPIEKTIEECERFFRSEWYQVLTPVDGEKIMKRIKGEINERITNSSNSKPCRDNR